ncbi:hypothetical protein [Sphingomonas pollutisoli]|uniref:hypothetical protein n=1 Tax=Sphingomonas pollutisoli TaxID=3030829 RepID=UPI0023B93092|nr:hypothetical protein [Sphingomonas pollutisoli]
MALPAVKALQSLDPQTRSLLAALLKDLQNDARARAQKSWDSRKPPLAAYWAAVGVYAGHVAKALRPRKSQRRRALTFTIRQPGYPDLPAANWADASHLHCRRRERSGLGASGFPEGHVLVDDVPIARISYNGCIWPLGAWSADMQPIYDNRNTGI